MKNFYPTYLYIKTHNTTGLKYFGKTSNDPYSYYGSGKYWLAHLKKHGYDISTEIYGYYEDREECRVAAEQFSIKNNIVESFEWANLINENGIDGGNTSKYRKYSPLSERQKLSLSKSNTGRKPWNRGIIGSSKGNTTVRSEETKKKLSNANKGKKLSADTKKKMSDSRKGKPRPEAATWLTGRPVSSETREKISRSQKGKPVSAETREKIKNARARQIITEETKEKLKGKVVVVDKFGNTCKISKEDYYSQPLSGADRQYVFHNCEEGKRRKLLNQEDAEAVAKMRR